MVRLTVRNGAHVFETIAFLSTGFAASRRLVFVALIIADRASRKNEERGKD